MQRKARRTLMTMEQILWKGVVCATVVLATTAIAAFTIGDRQVQAAEAVYDRVASELEEKRPTVKETVRNYVDSLAVEPVPTIAESENTDEEEESEAYMDYSDEDLELLAQVMYAEEGIFFSQWEENPDLVERVHKLAGSVVLNRLANEYRGSTTIKEVIFCKGQYALQTQERVTEGQEMPEEVYTWAEELLKDGPLGPNNLIFQSQFEQGDEVYEIIGNQYFCTWSNLPAEREEEKEEQEED